MRDSLYVHITWTTRLRKPLIDIKVAQYLQEHLPIIARAERATVLEIGIVRTHVHLLLRLHPSTAIPKLMQRMKGGTAAGANGLREIDGEGIRWAKGYSIDSVGVRSLDVVRSYVRSQPMRHPSEAIDGWPS